jgi:hypothetical protein
MRLHPPRVAHGKSGPSATECVVFATHPFEYTGWQNESMATISKRSEQDRGRSRFVFQVVIGARSLTACVATRPDFVRIVVGPNVAIVPLGTTEAAGGCTSVAGKTHEAVLDVTRAIEPRSVDADRIATRGFADLVLVGGITGWQGRPPRPRYPDRAGSVPGLLRPPTKTPRRRQGRHLRPPGRPS